MTSMVWVWGVMSFFWGVQGIHRFFWTEVEIDDVHAAYTWLQHELSPLRMPRFGPAQPSAKSRKIPESRIRKIPTM